MKRIIRRLLCAMGIHRHTHVEHGIIISRVVCDDCKEAIDWA